MNISILPLAFVVLSVTACGSSNSTPAATDTSIAPVTVTSGSFRGISLASAGAATVDITGLSLGTDTYTRSPGLDHGNFDAYEFTENGSSYVVFVATDTDVLAATGGRVGNNLSYGRSGTVIERKTALTMPTSGTATFNGDYVSVGQVTAIPATFQITGNVVLSADFSEMQVSGVVSNRIGTELGDPTNTGAIVDVQLDSAAINADGTFSGTASEVGGPLNGTHTGLFGGTNAAHAAGSVVMEDTVTLSPTATILETGVYTAAQ